MKKIDIAKWSNFHLYDIFDIDMGNKMDRSKMTEQSPTVNFVGRTGFNNGINAVVDEIKNISPYDSGNITVALGGSIGSAFVQEKPFYTSQNVIVLKPKTNISYHAKQFICSLIKRESDLHYQAFIKELNAHIKRDFQIPLPTKEKIVPDFEKLTEYIYIYISEESGGIDMSKIDTSRWVEFEIGDLFDITLSKDDIQPKNIVEGNTPLVSSGKENNGIVAYIADNNASLQSAGTITVDMFGKAFYQENSYHCVSHGRVNILTPKIPLNLHNGLFIANAIEAVTLSKYSFSEMCTSSKLKEDKILLPAKTITEPDWDYMERYMKAIEVRVCDKISKLESAKNIQKKKIDTNNWTKYKITDFFEVLKSRSKMTNADLIDDGEIPVYSSTTENNGIFGYTNKSADYIVDEKNPFYLIFGDHTKSMFIATKSFNTMDNVKVLLPKETMSEYAVRFITTQWFASIPDIGYARHWSLAQSSDFFLPTKNDKPDFEYMNNYMKCVHGGATRVLQALTQIVQ